MTRALFLVAMILFANGASAQTKTAKAPPKVAHAVSRTNLQLNAIESSPTLEIIEPGETLDVGGFSRDGAWVKVRTALGTIGYIRKRDLRPGPAPEAVSTPRPPRQGPTKVSGEAAYV